MSDQRLYLLDAFALIYRAYFAFGKNPLTNSKGQNVSAVSGFISNVYDLIQKEKPTHLAVCFDLGSTDRAAEHTFYKANRAETPEGISWAVPFIKEILRGMGIPILEKEGYEADDIVGTIAKKAEKQGYTVYMVTSDKDFGQLVSDNIFIHKPAYLKNPVEIMGVQEVLKRWDIENVDQVIDMLGLMGDASDNIPGIPGIGEKTANKLLKDFGSVEGVLANVDKLTGKVREKVEQGRELAIISKQLATIICDVPIEFDVHAFDYDTKRVDAQALTPIFRELEFRTLGKRIIGNSYELNAPANINEANTTPTPETVKPQAASDFQLDLFGNNTSAPEEQTIVKAGKNINNTPHTYYLADTADKRAELLSILLQQTLVCFDTETTGLDANQAELVGMSFSYQPLSAWYVPVPANQTDAKKLVDEFLPFFENTQIAKVAQNIKYDMLVLMWYGITLKGTLHDTMLAHYLLKPEQRHNMNYLAETYLGYSPVPIEELIGKKGKTQISMRQVPTEKIVEYAAEDADITLQLHHALQPHILTENMEALYNNVEMPVSLVLTQMEHEGVAIDVAFLKKYSKELGAEIETLTDEIYKLAGTPFNINSPKQLGDILFSVLNINGDQKNKKTKTGQLSTDEETLTRLAEEHTIIQKILEYRQLAKLRSTYVDAIPLLINPRSGRIHTTFNQAIAATGRLSSDSPNLQNIPIRTEKGREMRKAFIARSQDYQILAADYSQIELRLMAEMSQDTAMLEAFKNKLDIHTATAARVFNVKLEDVTSDMRRKAKMVNFGIIYGITAFGLSQRLKIKRTEAADIIEEYFKQYSGVKTYMDTSIEQVRSTGYAQTLLGRRRYLPDIYSANTTVRQFAERNAINMPIQGSAADMIKVAMVNIQQQINQQQLQSRMVLQVHDELVFEAHHSEIEHLQHLVTQNMRTALPNLIVPIEIGIGIGNNWLEAH
jgi:DNA polymerase-1